MRIGQAAMTNPPAAQYAVIRIGGVSMPDYNDYWYNTKSTPSKNDEQYKEAIIEQAKRDYSRGKFQNDSSDYRSLIKGYVSAVSPDRKSIIAEGLTLISKSPPTEDVGLADIKLGNGSAKYNKTDNEITRAEFYDSEGKKIASYEKGKWSDMHTPAETSRKSVFCSIYTAAWGEAKRADGK